MWGSGLSNVDVLACCGRAEVLSLSLNRISSLEPFQSCSSLRELYLRKNLVQDLSELGHLCGLEHLRILWLVSNPCSDSDPELYREVALRLLPSLERLDSTVVSPEERAELESSEPSEAAAKWIERAKAIAPKRASTRRSELGGGTGTTGRQQEDDLRSAGDMAGAGSGLRTGGSGGGGGARGGGELTSDPARRGGATGPGGSSSERVESRGSNSGGAGMSAGKGVTSASQASSPSKKLARRNVSARRRAGATQSRILTAVLTLLAELDGDGLRMVQEKCEELQEEDESTGGVP